MSTLGKTIATATISAAMIFTGASFAQAAPDSPREAEARAYIDALVSHDVTDVHFAPDATRVEAGIQTGFSGPQLSADLDHGVQYTVIQSVRDLRMTEDGDVVTAVYLLDAGVADTRLMTVEIRETFEIRDGLIHVIVADIMPVSLS